MSTATVEPPAFPPRFVRPNVGDDPERRRQYAREIKRQLHDEVHDIEDGILAVARTSAKRAVKDMGVSWSDASLAYATYAAYLDMALAAAAKNTWRWVFGHDELCPCRLGAAGFGEFIKDLRCAIGARHG